jgi:nucleoside-diphosphate-sugar epimerase
MSLRIAVTGVSGFIGRHVARALDGRGHTLVAAMRPGAGTAPAGWERVDLDLAHDIADPLAPLGRPDVLLHLAWEGLPNYASDTHLERELPRQQRLLEACLRGGLRRLVVAGTCLEYGLREGRLHEDFAPAPTTAYGRAKAQLCERLRTCADANGAELTWMRLFYLYGPGQAPTSLYAQLHAAIERGDAEFPMSPGDQSRDFQPVANAATTIADLVGDTTADAGIVNVCSGEPTTVLALVQQLIHARGATIRPVTGRFPYPSYEPFAAWGDRTRLDRLREAAR